MALTIMETAGNTKHYNKHMKDIMSESAATRGRGKGRTGSRFTKRTRGARDRSLRSRSRRNR